MRFVTEISGKANAEAFVAFLLGQNITTHVEPSDRLPDGWDVWVRDEDRVDEAKQFFREFKADPGASRYQDAVRQANKVIQQRRAKAASAHDKIRRGKDIFRRDLMSGKTPPVTLTLLILSIAVSLITRFGEAPANSFGDIMEQRLSFVSEADYKFENRKDPAASLRDGELWRTVTPIFLHWDALHILFNSFMLVSLGRIAERLLGSLRFTGLVLIVAIGSNLLQGLLPESYMGGAFFGGMSGVVYGLFGYIWIRSTLDPTLGFAFAPGLVMILLAWLFLNMSGMFETRVANMAHFGGLVIGGVLGYLATLRKK